MPVLFWTSVLHAKLSFLLFCNDKILYVSQSCLDVRHPCQMTPYNPHAFTVVPSSCICVLSEISQSHMKLKEQPLALIMKHHFKSLCKLQLVLNV